MSRKHYKPEVNTRKVYMTQKMINIEKERLKIEKQCQERNKFKDYNESLFNNEGDLL